jgi:hypothetical protein
MAKHKKPKATAGMKKVEDTRVVPDRNVVASASTNRGGTHHDKKNDYRRKPKHSAKQLAESGIMTFKEFLVETAPSK